MHASVVIELNLATGCPLLSAAAFFFNLIKNMDIESRQGKIIGKYTRAMASKQRQRRMWSERSLALVWRSATGGKNRRSVARTKDTNLPHVALSSFL